MADIQRQTLVDAALVIADLSGLLYEKSSRVDFLERQLAVAQEENAELTRVIEETARELEEEEEECKS